MGSIDRRLESLEAGRKRRGARLTREALRDLSDEELDALEESLDAEEQPPPNELLREIERSLNREAEEESRRAKKGEMQ